MSGMIQYLRELHFASVVVRLALAMLLGGCIGLERGRKRRPAGFRTYMLVCLGAALTVLLSLYEFTMVTGCLLYTSSHPVLHLHGAFHHGRVGRQDGRSVRHSV